MQNAQVTVAYLGDRSGWYYVAPPTDVGGITTLSGISMSEVMLDVTLPGGERALLPVTLRLNETTDVHVTASSALLVRLLDHDLPIRAVEVAVLDEAGLAVLNWMETSAVGTAEWTRISEGVFVVSVNYPGYFPVQVRLESSITSEEHLIQVRRTGSIAVATMAGGAAVGGVQFDLRSMEFDKPVGQWLADGKVDSTSGALATDSLGRVRLDGLPHGDYEWTISVAGADARMGLVHVTPQRVEALTFFLD